ncbi:MAG: substrate-binding domain-containing protein [Pseudomonadota bacterium]
MMRVLALLATLLATVPAFGEELRLAVTTSFENSGLADALVPAMEADLGFDIALLVVGTGQALRLGRAGDVDAVLVHARAMEDAFVAEGFATHRREIMYNDFVVVGPADDPAHAAVATNAADAFAAIAAAKTPFVSRGDASGTHTRELQLWAAAGFRGAGPDESAGGWYREAGAGMGATLNIASAMEAYTLVDRASWLNFGNRGELKLLHEGDPALLNQYAYLPVSRQEHPHVRADLTRALENWLVSERGQQLIGAHTVGGAQLFVPNAKARERTDG